METSGKHPERVAGNYWFVLFAYFLVIAAWYAICGNVFISSRWRTVAETRKRGHRHLFALVLSMSYLAVYVYFQAKSGDYKELCLALVAFAVAILHMLRTLLGLWQLYVFRHWVIRSIGTMESLGYRIQLSGTRKGKNTHRERSSSATQEQGRDRAHVDADNIIVNETIVGNRLSEGGVQCELQFYTPQQKQNMFCADSFLMGVSLKLFYMMKSTVCFGGIVWPLLFSRSPLYSKPDSTQLLRPREPEELWLRWATVLISCAFPNWVTDMRKSRSRESTREESQHQVQRDKFAEDILRSAALHCEGDATAKTSPGSLMPFHLGRKFPKLSSGIFCKQEFLKHAGASGNGLPFQAPHKHAASRIEHDMVYSYAKYRSQLQQARDALPVSEGEKLAFLGIEELEWLSIFLSVEDWSAGIVEHGKVHKNPNNLQPPKSDCSGIAIENLCNQLGFPENLNAPSKRLAAPFLKGKEGAALWGNRNVLTLSAHVDNWLTLRAGEQVAFNMEQVPDMEETPLFRNLKAEDSENRTQETIGVTEGIPEEAMCHEKQRPLFQLSVAEPDYSHFEHSLTFLGCSMENLRSSMAKWVESNPEEQSGAWGPTLCSSRDSTDAMNCRKFVSHASKNFESHLSKVSSVSCWSQRYLQMRLLWELQNNLHSTLSEQELAPNRPEAIMLCILSFPAIRVVASEIDRTPEAALPVQENWNFCCINIDEKPSSFRIEDCKLTLRASYGPQNVHLEIFFTKQVKESGIVVTAQLCSDEFEKGKPFVWEAWRDAFYRSLQSTRQWQAEHQIANSSLSVSPCIGSIGQGIYEIETGNSGIGPIMKVWKGWPPHRETFSKYEMLTDGLILERKKMALTPAKARIVHGKSIFVERPPAQYVPVSYAEATSQHLTPACLIAQEFLRKAAGSAVDGAVDGSSKRRRDLELLRYVISATRAGDDVALGKVMNMLVSRNPSREAVERAGELLEEYYTSEAAKAPSVRILESLYRPARKESWLQNIKGHYEDLMNVTRYDPRAVTSFAGFCSAVSFHHKNVTNEDGIRALTIAIVRTAYSGNILFAFELTKSLEMLLETGNEERYYLACSLDINDIEKATKILSRPRNGVVLPTAQRLRKAFLSFFGTPENSCGEENIPLLPGFRSALEKRKADAQDRLKQLFINSETHEVEAYASRAAQLYTKAGDEGDLFSAYHLGFLLDNGVGVSVDECRATELYTRAMNGGVDSALFPLALRYQVGLEVPKNPSYAAELYSRAIEKRGHIISMYNLADMLQQGAEGVPADLPRAFQLFSRAVEEGGDVDAMRRVAFIVEEGGDGVPKDAPYAVRLYERAIKEGDHKAKNHLAHMLQSGAEGVPSNLKRAIALYKSAIDEIGDAGATVKLAELYQKGTGVPHDAVRAAQLFESVVDSSGKAGKLARVHLADMLTEGAVGLPRDPIRAVQLYTRAIEEHGSGDAMYGLACMLEFGKKGVPSDSTRALSLFKRAASEKKHSQAARRLRKVVKQKQVLEQAQHVWSENTTEGDENLLIIDIVG